MKKERVFANNVYNIVIILRLVKYDFIIIIIVMRRRREKISGKNHKRPPIYIICVQHNIVERSSTQRQKIIPSKDRRRRLRPIDPAAAQHR